jgi:hypothetical protein
VADGLALAISQAEVVSDHEEVTGDDAQCLTGHALVGEMAEVTEAFLGQGTGALAGQRMGSLEELIEHSRTS